MVAGVSPDDFGLLAEFKAAGFQDVEQGGAISEVVVGQGLIQQGPVPFGGLEFGTMRRQERSFQALGHFDRLSGVEARLIER